MTLNELIMLDRLSAVKCINLIKKYTNRQMPQLDCVALVKIQTASKKIQSIDFVIEHHSFAAVSTAKRTLDENGLKYRFHDLTGASEIRRFCSPLPRASQSSLSTETVDKTCTLCGKKNLDDSTGCYNPSVFSPCVGDWICNVNMELSK